MDDVDLLAARTCKNNVFLDSQVACAVVLDEIKHWESSHQTGNASKICFAGFHLDLLICEYLLDVSCDCLGGYQALPFFQLDVLV